MDNFDGCMICLFLFSFVDTRCASSCNFHQIFCFSFNFLIFYLGFCAKNKKKWIFFTSFYFSLVNYIIASGNIHFTSFSHLRRRNAWYQKYQPTNSSFNNSEFQFLSGLLVTIFSSGIWVLSLLVTNWRRFPQKKNII